MVGKRLCDLCPAPCHSASERLEKVSSHGIYQAEHGPSSMPPQWDVWVRAVEKLTVQHFSSLQASSICVDRTQWYQAIKRASMSPNSLIASRSQENRRRAIVALSDSKNSSKGPMSKPPANQVRGTLSHEDVVLLLACNAWC